MLAILSAVLTCLVLFVLLSWKPNQTDLMLSLWQMKYESNPEQAIEFGSEMPSEHTEKSVSLTSSLAPLTSSMTEPKREQAISPMQKQNGVRFLYMLQTESCLSSYLQEVIGDPSVCPCDVLVLSFRTNCTKPHPPNVEYIFTGTRTSWGGGRNVLYEEAMKKEQVYLYFIILDDDIVINKKSDKDSNGTPWRMFEEFLVRVEPANAAIDIENNLWLHRAGNGRKHMNCTVDESAEYLSVARYDAAFNAFHNKTIRYILPYLTKYDRSSWIFAPMYINIKIEVMYAGHSVLHNKIFAHNPQHRPYLRHYPNPREWNDIVNEAAKEMPEKYRNSSLMQGWRRSGLGHEQWSPTVCIPPPPPKMPITRFAYLDGKLAVKP